MTGTASFHGFWEGECFALSAINAPELAGRAPRNSVGGIRKGTRYPHGVGDNTRKTNEEIVAAMRKAGAEVTVVKRTPGMAEVMFLPGIKQRNHTVEFDEFAPERDNDGSGVVDDD